MEIRITTLSENTATFGYIAEWGLSLLVEVDGLRLLMDTGLGQAALNNAELMGIDLRGLDKLILSHGHGDHTGGLREVLRRGRGAEIIGHPAVWEPKYARHRQERERFTGIPFQRLELESLGGVFRLTPEPVYITDNIFTTGEIPVTTDYEPVDKDLFVKVGEALQPDLLPDDQALIINAPPGLVVVLGCAHRGLINTLRHAQRLARRQEVYAIIGGTHLFRANEERVERTIADLREMGVQKIGVSHCTGFKACARLAQEFGEAFFQNNSGTRTKLP